jgi:hypothetical protein
MNWGYLGFVGFKNLEVSFLKKKKLILSFFGSFFLGLSHGFVFFVRLYSWEADYGGFLEDSKKYSGMFI